jgi:single-stranded-DNA-specific exonuclease
MKWEKRQPKSEFDQQDDIVSKLAKIRGIGDVDAHLSPSSDYLHDPYLLGNIKEAAAKIIDAVKKGKLICVSMDCDADGIFSTAIMMRYLRQFTENLYFIFAERDVGHGIEYQMDKVLPETELLIILDSSSNSIKACKELKNKGIDIIILDHHIIEEHNPHALIVNPQSDNYPNKQISGATLAYKMVSVLDDTFGTGEVEDYIDLAAYGMYADVMSALEMENRHIIIQGMENVRNKGIKALLKSAKQDGNKFNCQTISFTISPMINGVARMNNISLAIELLLEDDIARCFEIAEEIRKLNEERKKISRTLVEKYSQTVNEKDKIIIAVDTMASKGFNGSVAMELAQRYKRPAMVLRLTHGIVTGSYRTFADFKLKSFLNKFYHINYAAGHEEAGGVELKEIHLDVLKEYINKHIKADAFVPKVEYDLELDIKDVHYKFVREIESFNHLTGKGIPEAKFLIRNLFVEDRQVIGKNKDTVKITCEGIELIKFKVDADYALELETFDKVDVIGSLSVNQFMGRRGMVTTMQLKVDDYKKAR